MSVLIRGMEMPTSCVDCGLKINCDECEGYECYCPVLGKCIGYMPREIGSFLREDAPVIPKNSRIDGCPLVPVPAHGKMIIRDGVVIERDGSTDVRDYGRR